MTRVPLKKLHPAPWNPRSLKDDRFKNLCKSIEADPGLLDLRPILATKDGTIYGGNQRYRAVQHLGWTDVPAELSDIPEQLAKERALKDNGAWGAWVDDDLGSLLAELKDAGSDIDLLGFDSPELDRLLAGVTQLPEEDEADFEPPVEPITKSGDLWLLGEHRLLCGDSTNLTDVERLMNGEQAELLLTDPPYNVGLTYTDATDDRREDYDEWTRDWFGLAVTKAHRAIVTPGAVNLTLWLRLFEPQHVGVWFKGMGATTHGRVTKYWAWEPLMFHGEKWKRERHIDVFEYPGGGTMVKHPCPKPIGLWVDLIQNFTERTSVVLDVFGGSGSTVIAAEQTGRRALALELDPGYCDVIVNRWEKLTNQKAVLDGAAH